MLSRYFRVAFPTLFLGLSGAAIIARTDLMPFSHYPMFSTRPKLSDVQVFRLALGHPSGEQTFWKPYFEYSSRDFDLSCKAANDSKDPAPLMTDALKRAKFEIEKFGTLSDIATLSVVKRTVKENPAGGFTFLDQVVFKADLGDLK